MELKYQSIAADLRERIAAAEFAAGRHLPSEAELGGAYAASRMTVRKALEALRDEGLVGSRQGFGWFVAAPPRVAAVLGAGRVLAVRRVNVVFPERLPRPVSGGHPPSPGGVAWARVTVWCPEGLAAHLSLADVERTTFHELLGVELAGATQTIAAAAVEAADAEVLGVPVGSPALVCERVTRSVGGDPVLVAEHVFPGHLTEFVVELAQVDASVAPSGLRLVR